MLYLAVFALLFLFVLVFYVNYTPTPAAYFARFLLYFQPLYTPKDFKEVLKEITVVRDIQYPSEFGSNFLNVYMPKDKGSLKLPTVVSVHGGSYVGGDKSKIDVWNSFLASKGVVVISMNYALAPEAKYPTPIKQVADVSDFLKTLAQDYPIDLDRIFFAGDSAGAQIAAQFTTTQANKDYATIMNIPQVVDLSSIRGALLYSGPYDIKELNRIRSKFFSFIFNKVGWVYFGIKEWKSSDIIKQASILNYIDENYPSSFITDGNMASFEEHSRLLVAKLREKNVYVDELFFDRDEDLTFHDYHLNLRKKTGRVALDKTVTFIKKQSQ